HLPGRRGGAAHRAAGPPAHLAALRDGGPGSRRRFQSRCGRYEERLARQVSVEKVLRDGWPSSIGCTPSIIGCAPAESPFHFRESVCPRPRVPAPRHREELKAINQKLDNFSMTKAPCPVPDRSSVSGSSVVA